MKKVALAGLLLLAGACNNSEPAATGYKSQLSGAPAAAAGDQKPSPAAGDSAKGQAAFTASCVGCHATPDALTADQKSRIATAATFPAHAGKAVQDAFTKDGANLTAFLKGGSATPAAATGDAAKGEAMLVAKCDGCHKTNGIALDEFVVLQALKDLSGAGAKAAHAGVQTIFDSKDATLDDLAAGLKLRKAQ